MAFIFNRFVDALEMTWPFLVTLPNNSSIDPSHYPFLARYFLLVERLVHHPPPPFFAIRIFPLRIHFPVNSQHSATSPCLTHLYDLPSTILSPSSQLLPLFGNEMGSSPFEFGPAFLSLPFPPINYDSLRFLPLCPVVI